MVSRDRLAEIDRELDAFGLSSTRIDAVLARARDARMTAAEVDLALASLDERFETRVPEGALARSGSWARPEPSPASTQVAASAELEPAPSPLEEAQLPAVLSERPPSTEGIEVDLAPTTAEVPLEASDPVDPDDRPSVEIRIEPATSLADDDVDEGTDVLGRAELAAAEAAREAELAIDEVAAPRTSQPPPVSNSALELDIEGEPASVPVTPEQSSAKFSVPKDSVHPSPKSVIPPPPTAAELEADLASMLADELQPPEAPADEPAELESEATALFSADMFGAAPEPNLAELISRPPPAGDSSDVEIDIDEDVLVYESESAASPPSPGTRPPPPPPRSAPPPPGKPGFLGRLLNRKS
ncbi:MAG: hypothetical protein K1X94_14130 [Sandaracinaceae bacterium]|nr:hypothetical protein [Sandaracinaceae bacterium]